MKGWSNKSIYFLLFAGLICLYILSVLFNLGYLDLKVEEPRRAIISLEMLQSGNVIQPHTLGWEYYNKPPAFNWILTSFIFITGSDSEFAVRLPSFIFLLIFGICYYFISRKYLSETVAAISTFFLLTSADLYFYTLSNGAEIDVFYGFVVYLQAISMFWFYEKRKFGLLFIISWSLCAVGFLTKGFPSLIFQFLTLAALCVYTRSVKLIFRPQHLVGIFFFLILTGSYFYVYSHNHSVSVLLINQLKESLLKSAVGQESSGRLYKVFTYPVVLFRVLAPWCLILLVLLKKRNYKLFDNPLVRFSALFILLNIAVYWITAAQKTRYIIMFIPFAMTILSYLYWQFEKENPGKFNSYCKYAGVFFFLPLVGLLVLPFFLDIVWWKILSFTGLLLVFLFVFFRLNQHRIWLFITGVVLIRLIYAVIGIPEKGQREFSYKEKIKVMAAKNDNQQVYFWGQPDTLDLNIIIGDTLFAWKNKPVQVLPGISYQIPYYFYRATGMLVKFDTIMEQGKTYISNSPYLKNMKIEPIDSFYDIQQRNYLIMFRTKSGP